MPVIVPNPSGDATVLAQPGDVEARLGRDLSEGEAARAEALLEDVSAQVVGYLGQTFPIGAVPPAVVGVVAKMTARLLSSGSSGGPLTDQVGLGGLSLHYSAGSTSGDAWMTRGDRTALRPYRLGGGLTSARLVTERYAP